MDAPLYSFAGEELGRISLPEDIFGLEPNRAVMHQALLRQLANMRRGTHRTQTRSEVSRTSAKWYRQKGTGRARHGSRTAHLFVGGAVAHGPQHRSYGQRMPRQMRRLALRSALSDKAREGSLIVVDDMNMAAPKTRLVAQFVARVCEDRSTLMLLAGRNEAFERSVRNLPHVRYLRSAYLNVRDLMNHDWLVMERPALEAVIEHLGKRGSDDDGEGSDAQP